MAKKVLSFKGLFGDHGNTLHEMLIHIEPLQERTMLYDYEIQEHVHSHLVQLFFITDGGGLLQSTDTKVSLDSPCLLFVPHHMLHGFIFPSDVRGHVLTMPVHFFDSVTSNNKRLFSGFDRLQYFPLIDDTPSLQEITNLIKSIEVESAKSKTESEETLPLLLQLLLIFLLRSEKESQSIVLTMDDKALRHYRAFEKLVKTNFHEQKSVQFYAQELLISSVHLNRICKTVVQKTSLQVIHDVIINEAKRYLKGTSLPIAEIAFLINFKDAAHFSKFFKKKAGLSPREYRK